MAKTLIYSAPHLNRDYEGYHKGDPHISIQTKGDMYHRRMAAAHKQIYDAVLTRYYSERTKKYDLEIAKIQDVISRIQHNKPYKNALNKISHAFNEDELKELQVNDGPSVSKFRILFRPYHIANDTKKAILAETAIHSKNLGSDSVNFALAEIVLIVSTKNGVGATVKTLPISFPLSLIKIGSNSELLPVFHYQHLAADKAIFKNACQLYQDKSKAILEEAHLSLQGKASELDYQRCNASYFPQISYHSEKFLFYHLLNGGLQQIVNCFASKGIVPSAIASIDAMELRIHSTRDICHSCEVLSIGAKAILKEAFNTLVIQNHFAALNDAFRVSLSMSYDMSDRVGKLSQDSIGLQTLNTAQLAQSGASTENCAAHRYTVFESGGESNASSPAKQRNIHIKAIEEIQAQNKICANILEKRAGKTILRYLRNWRAQQIEAIQYWRDLKMQKDNTLEVMNSEIEHKGTISGCVITI